MKIEIWSDYACPFCYIGEKRLEKALAAIPEKNIEVIFKSFELDPAAPKNVTSNTVDRFAEKYGLTKTEAAEHIEQISEMGRAEGIEFNYASTLYTNTFDALRLTKFAQEKGHNEIISKLFDAYFTKNLELSNFDVLKKIAAECGLDSAEVENFLNSDKYAAEVRADEMQAARYGIHGVPFFIVGEKYTLSGAQPAKILQQAIEDYLAENSLDGMTCGADGCKFDG